MIKEQIEELSKALAAMHEAISESEAVPVDYSVVEEPEKVPSGRKYF